jgi:hypothetical protein
MILLLLLLTQKQKKDKKGNHISIERDSYIYSFSYKKGETSYHHIVVTFILFHFFSIFSSYHHIIIGAAEEGLPASNK